MQIIPITVTNKIASVPCGTFIVADNTDYQLQFAFDEEWTAYDLKTCRFLVKGQYVDVDFTGSTVTIPSMPSDAYRINVGVFAGDLSTTTPAQIMVMSSVLATQGTEYDPAEPSVLPDVDELALDDTFVITDVSEGEKARANIGQIVDYVQSAATLQPYDSDPEMDGEGSAGTSTEYARGDHVHPADPTILHSGDEAALIQIYQSTVPFSQGWFCGQTATEVAQIISSQTKYVVEGNSELWDTIYFNPDAVGTEDSFVTFESIIPQNGGEAVRRVTFNGYMIGLMSETSLYSKPTNGIPSNDLDEDVNRSLDHADKAVRFEAQLLSKEQQTQARSNIGAASLSDIGTVFTIKGEVTNVSDLPATGNTVGDVYYVSSVQAGYIWLETTDHPNGYWEELGEPIDLSAYAPINSPAFTGTPTAPTAGTSTNNTQIATTAFVKSVIPSVPSASSATPQALGTAAAGSSADYSRADHVHAKPSASDVGAIPAPVSASSGDVLTYDGSAWGAASAPTEVYWCTYGTTTNADIETAYAANKLVCVKYDGRVYVLVGRGSATSHSFSLPYYVSTPAIYSVHCSGNVWSASSKILIGAPSSPSTGDTLVYDGSAWVAQNPTPEVTVSSAGAVTQALDAGKIYHFTGAVTALTITFNAASGVAQYHFDFVEGSTAFDPVLPSGVKLPDNHTWEADTRYEVDILNNYAVVVGWAVV